MDARVQVVIPVYNAEKHIEKCLDSLKAQTFEQWQAIIIDDASLDRSGEIVKKYASEDARFIYIRKEKNGGASEARNTALEMLTAEYTAFLDADDYWEKEMLEVLVKKADSGFFDIVQCRFIYDFPKGKTVLPKGAFSGDTELCGKELKKVCVRMMTGINMNHVCMKLIKTSLIGDLRFDTTLKTAEDLKFCIGLFKKAERYFFVNRVMYHYRRSEESLTGRGLPLCEKLEANKKVSAELMSALPEWDMDSVFYRILSYIRPYTIAVSKVLRILREKIVS